MNNSYNNSIKNNNNSLNNNNDDNNNEYNIKLNNLVWNNIYIKSIILNHLNKFNILYNNIEFASMEEWDQFKYKEYLYNVKFEFKFEDLNKLPHNICKVTIMTPTEFDNSITIPAHIESIALSHSVTITQFNSPFIKSIIGSIATSSNSKFKKLGIQDYDRLLDQSPISIPESIEDLVLSCFGYKLPKDLLPKGLKRLILYELISFEDGCLPESLTDIIISYAPPQIINQLSTNSALVKLDLITSDIDSSIVFPSSLKHLSIKCSSFNSTLPSGLISLEFPISSLVFGTAILPDSLETLHLYGWIDDDQMVYQIQFPSSLTHLDLGYEFTQELTINFLPSRLVYLNLSGLFNQVIDIGVLPSTLESLWLGKKYTQVINPLAIPQQLKLLAINNEDYNHPIKLTPSTHPYTVIECHNLNLYYDPSNTDIRVLRLPYDFNSSLSTLLLQDKSKLECLHLAEGFNQPIQLSDLPIDNQIKTLELGFDFSYAINLEHFQNLESIIINYHPYNILSPQIITTTHNNNNNNITYNNYKLKNIIVSPSFSQFIKQLDINFYQFIKLKKE